MKTTTRAATRSSSAFPDLTLTKTDNVGGATTLGNPWTWTLHVANSGTAAASFTDTQTVVLDNLPNANINYGTVSISNITNVTGNAEWQHHGERLDRVRQWCRFDRSGR